MNNNYSAASLLFRVNICAPDKNDGVIRFTEYSARTQIFHNYDKNLFLASAGSGYSVRFMWFDESEKRKLTALFSPMFVSLLTISPCLI